MCFFLCICMSVCLFYILYTCWYLSVTVIFPFLLESVKRCPCTVYILRQISLSSPPPPCLLTLPLPPPMAEHSPWPSIPALPPLLLLSQPITAARTITWPTDRGAGRWNRMLTIHHPERDGSNTAAASPDTNAHTHTHTHTHTGTQTEIYTHTFRKRACQSRGNKTAAFGH